MDWNVHALPLLMYSFSLRCHDAQLSPQTQGSFLLFQTWSSSYSSAAMDALAVPPAPRQERRPAHTQIGCLTKRKKDVLPFVLVKLVPRERRALQPSPDSRPLITAAPARQTLPQLHIVNSEPRLLSLRGERRCGGSRYQLGFKQQPVIEGKYT